MREINDEWLLCECIDQLCETQIAQRITKQQQNSDIFSFHFASLHFKIDYASITYVNSSHINGLQM